MLETFGSIWQPKDPETIDQASWEKFPALRGEETMRKAAIVTVIIGLSLAFWSPASGASNGSNDIIHLEAPEGAPDPNAFGTAHLVGYYLDGENPQWDTTTQLWLELHKIDCLFGDLMYTAYVTIGDAEPIRLLNFNASACGGGNASAIFFSSPELAEMFDHDVTVEIVINQDGSDTYDGIVVMTGSIDRP